MHQCAFVLTFYRILLLFEDFFVNNPAEELYAKC